MSGPGLTTLPKSPERYVLEAAVAIFKADSLASSFPSSIRVLETPSWDSMLSFATGSVVFQPATVKMDDFPSRRQISHLTLWISFYLPREPTEEDSNLYGLDLLGYLRAMFWGASYIDPNDPGIQMNTATTGIRVEIAHEKNDQSARILTYAVTFDLDVDPKGNTFSS
jgi:hypothetical protein